VSVPILIGPAPRRTISRASVAARRLWDSDYRPALIATGLATLLAWGFLLLPPMNTDMSAQLARADFAGRYPLSIVDFRWFGGTVVYGYTLWASILMAHVGTKLTGAVAAVVGTWFTTRLLGRVRPVHPVIGGLAAAVSQVANVLEGRITFAVGLTCGLIALSLVTTTRLPRSSAALLAAVFGALCGGASPVAALLLGIPGAVALFAGRRQDAALLLLPAAGAAAVASLVFGDGGRQPFSFVDCARSVIALAVVLAVVPARCRLLRIGAALGIVLVAAAFVLPTPVGSNASRLSLLFALPVTAAFVQLRTPTRSAALLLGMFVLQLPVNPAAIASTGHVSGYSDYYRPVIDAIEARGPLAGRVEVPEMAGHWDAVYLARGLPLARGWLRQTDVRLNDEVFYRHDPTPQSYWDFLRTDAVQYVALPDAPLTSFGAKEADLIATRVPYLEPVWLNSHWTLYEVLNPTALVDPPGDVLRQNPDTITISVPASSRVLVRLRWSHWLGLQSDDPQACIAPDGLYVTLRTGSGGTYTFDSRFPVGTRHCD
jgi:hypothetical protein